MQTPDDWLAIEYRVFADFPRAFFVHTSSGWLYAIAKFAGSQEDSAPFEVYDMGAIAIVRRVAPPRSARRGDARVHRLTAGAWDGTFNNSTINHSGRAGTSVGAFR